MNKLKNFLNKNYSLKLHEITLISLIVALLFLVGALTAIKHSDLYPIANSSTSSEDTGDEEEINPADETDYSVIETPGGGIYESSLYPGLSFQSPEGWTVSEYDSYQSPDGTKGSANSTINITDGNKNTISLDLKTVTATGFEGYSCKNYPIVVKVGDVYRISDSSGEITYEAGITDLDESWRDATVNEGYTNYKEGFHNYCVTFPFLGTFETKIKQADFPEYPYGYNDEEIAFAWLSVALYGDFDTELLQVADKLVESIENKSDK